MKKLMKHFVLALVCAVSWIVLGLSLHSVKAYDYFPIFTGGMGGEAPRLEATVDENGKATFTVGPMLLYFYNGQKAIDHPEKVEWYVTPVTYDITHYSSHAFWLHYCQDEFYKATGSKKLFASKTATAVLDTKKYSGMISVCAYYDGKCLGDVILNQTTYGFDHAGIILSAKQDYFSVKNNTPTDLTLEVNHVWKKKGTTLTYQWITATSDIPEAATMLEGETKKTLNLKGITGQNEDKIYGCIVSDGTAYRIEYFRIHFNDNDLVDSPVQGLVIVSAQNRDYTFSLQGKNIDVKCYDEGVQVNYDETKGECTVRFPYKDGYYFLEVIDKNSQQMVNSYTLQTKRDDHIKSITPKKTSVIGDFKNSDGFYLADFAFTASADGFYTLLFEADSAKTEMLVNSSGSSNRIWVWGNRFSRYFKKGDTITGTIELSALSPEVPINETAKVNMYVLNGNGGRSEIALKAKKATYNGKAISVAKATVKGTDGKVTYTYYTDAKCKVKTTQKNSGASKTGGAPVKAGTYYVKAKAAANDDFVAVTSTAAKLTISKAAPTIKAKTTKKTYRVSSLKKATAKFSLGATVSGKGTLSFKKVSGASCLSVNKSGNVSVKKGTKAGTYSMKVKVSSASSENYAKANKTFTIKVTVK